jgi:hypothetical protein
MERTSVLLEPGQAGRQAVSMYNDKTTDLMMEDRKCIPGRSKSFFFKNVQTRFGASRLKNVTILQPDSLLAYTHGKHTI